MLSTLVFTRSLLKYFTAIGLVKNRDNRDTTRNRITWIKIGACSRAAKMATSAPAANHMVVSPKVNTSIPIHKISSTIQKIIISSISNPSTCPSSALYCI